MRKSVKRTTGRRGGLLGPFRAVLALPQVRPFPCGIPFATSGTGAANLGGANPVGLAFGRAYRDAEAVAKRICRTNPRCPNPAFINMLFITFAVRGGRLWCGVIVLWRCVPPGPGGRYYGTGPRAPRRGGRRRRRGRARA